MRIAIVGGGIGGFSAALAIAKAGLEVTVFEQSPGVHEVGAGIQISPNAIRVLEYLGLGVALKEISVFPERVVFRRWQDDAIIRETSVDEAFSTQHGSPLSNLARTDLIEILAAAVRAQPMITVYYGSHVTQVEPGENESTIVFADGTASTFDIVIGADGIHSVVRPSVGGTDSARFSGSVAYRALVPGDAARDLPIEVTNRVGPDRHVVSYFIGRDCKFFNLVCISPENDWTTESWTERGTLDDLRSRFEGWSPQFLSIIDRVEEPIFRWALYDREPLAQWGVGTTTLLGDAAHPMLPFMAQGSCQAIEDAVVLSRCLSEVGTTGIAQSLRRYEDARRERTSQIQTASFMNRDLFHMPDGQGQKDRDAFLSSGVGGLSALDWVYGHDALSAPI